LPEKVALTHGYWGTRQLQRRGGATRDSASKRPRAGASFLTSAGRERAITTRSKHGSS